MARSERSEIARGIRAASELTETQAAFDLVEARLLEEIVKTPVGGDTRILKLHAALQNLAAVKTALMRTVANGQHAEAAAEALASVDLIEAD